MLCLMRSSPVLIGEGVVHGVLATAEPWEMMNRQQMCVQVVMRSWETNCSCYMRRALIARHANHRLLVPNENMEFIPYGNSLRSPLKFAELFCGGFSGWTRAFILMASRAFPGRVAVSLDRGRSVFDVHGRNFACREISETGFAMNDLTNKTGCCACISRFEPLCAKGATGWLCSPPCPAFSAGGFRGEKGWNHEDALPFKPLFGNMRLARPWFVAIENVPPLKTDPKFHSESEAWCSWAGYRIHWEAVVSRSGYSTVDRSRFLAVLKKCEGPDLIGTALTMPHCARKNMQEDGVWRTLPRELSQQHVLDPETKAIYLCQECLPAEVRNSPDMYMSRYIWKYRSLEPSNRISSGTVMASYGNQHGLSQKALRQEGIFGKLIRLHPQSEDLRWLTAAEIALGLGITSSSGFPCHWKQYF